MFTHRAILLVLVLWAVTQNAGGATQIGVSPDGSIVVSAMHDSSRWYYEFRRHSHLLGRVKSAFEYPAFRQVDGSNAELCWRPDSRYLVVHDGHGMDSAPPDIVLRFDETVLHQIEIPMPDLGDYTRSTYPSFVRFAAGDAAVFTVPAFRDRLPRQKTFTYTLDLRSGRKRSIP